MMASITLVGTIWDEAAEAEALELARQFESAWKQSSPLRRPEPLEFLGSERSTRTAWLLALLRVDLAHRRRLGEDLPVESYRDRYPILQGDALVALVYEDFCLREEAGDGPDPAEYQGRFPEIAGRLGEVFEIHELVAEPGSTAPEFDTQAIPFPDAGQTIAGFHLVEELGRGSFARVFLSRERQLGDRAVALKVSRTGSREPQTMARLQHTHIVPVHSYRVDPATGLHLLCMPYFGRVTLARLLGDSESRNATLGADLLRVLDRLDPLESQPAISAARSKLARLPYARAIAWWGARLAEGLQHAHDRGVLHRDVKPSNVLIAGDGMPMLLDFNLAREADLDGDSVSKLGGTLAYMAPEHLEALGERDDRAIDHRADIYSLGMVLLEALGVKPKVGPSEGSPLLESLSWLLDQRRTEAPRLDESPVEIPPALEAVVRRCLAPDPNHRYASAADLAIDLQAVADDVSLRFAAEPWLARSARRLRNHRRRLAFAGVMLIAVGSIIGLQLRARAERIRQEQGVRDLILDGSRSADRFEFQSAADQFLRALILIQDRDDLGQLQGDLNRRLQAAQASILTRDRVDEFFDEAETLRFAFLGFEGDRLEASERMSVALRQFDIGGSDLWTNRPELRSLDIGRKTRLVREVDDLLFFRLIAEGRETRDRSRSMPIALDYCDQALRFTDQPAPWRALRDWWADPAGHPPALPSDLASETSAASCFRWYLLGKLAIVPDRSTVWLERANRLDPENYWHQFALAFERLEAGRADLALAPASAAIALRPGSSRAWKVRARIDQKLGRWASSLDDLDRALDVCRSTEQRSRVRLDRGRIRQQLGDFIGADHDYYFVQLFAPEASWMARDARRNLARLAADRGFDRQALTLYDDLIATEPTDSLSRRGRARLLLRNRRASEAEADLSFLIAGAKPGDRASYLAERALSRLVQDRPTEAEVDAQAAFRLVPSSAHARLVGRARLAANHDLEVWPSDPGAFDSWPDGGRSLATDLRSAAARLVVKVHEPGNAGSEARFTRAVLLSSARNHAEALAEVDRLVATDRQSARFRRLRAAILDRAGRFLEALDDVAAGLAIEPENPDLIELRGKIRVQSGQFESGLIDLKVAADRGANSAVGPLMAEALGALERSDEGVAVWSKLVQDDPLDVQAWIGLAASRRQRGDVDSALAALEEAAGVVPIGSPFMGRLALEYARCLPARPDRWSRLVDLGRRSLVAKSRK